MTITDKDITFSIKGKVYKVPFVIMAEDQAVLFGLLMWGAVDLSIYGYEGRKMRMRDVLMKMNYDKVINVFLRKECAKILKSCFLRNETVKPHSRAYCVKMCKEIISKNIKSWLRQMRTDERRQLIIPGIEIRFNPEFPENQISDYAYAIYCRQCEQGERWQTINGHKWSEFFMELHQHIQQWKKENEKPIPSLNLQWNF